MATGTIMWFNNTTKYGRLVCDRTGTDRFIADVDKDAGHLQAGDKVSYDEEADPKGPTAINLFILPRPIL